MINGVGNWPHIANPMGAADAVNAFLDGLGPDIANPRPPGSSRL